MNLKKCLLEVKVLKLLIIFGALSTIIVLAIYYLSSNNYDTNGKYNHPLITSNGLINENIERTMEPISIKLPLTGSRLLYEKYNQGEFRSRSIREKIKRLTSNNINSGAMQLNVTKAAKFSTKNIHIFYSIPVNWYQTNNSQYQTEAPTMAETNGEIRQLNSMQIKRHQPNIVFYPMLGLYKIDSKILAHHFENIKKLGTAVLIVTWSPAFQKYLLQYLLDELYKYDLQMTIEIDDYPNRTVNSIFNDLDYFYKEFWFHNAFHKVFMLSKNKYLPMFYIKNSDLLPATEWTKLLSDNGVISLRRSLHDAIFIGHISTKKQVSLIKTSNFNGFYTRTPSNGATYTSTWKNWAPLKKSADEFKLIFIPTVGPGYNENKKQPKTGSTRHHRTNGHYYGVAWRSAMTIQAQFVTIASYNDWPSGTQIEEAISRNGCKDYSPGGANKYLDLTRHWIDEFVRTRLNELSKRSLVNCYAFLNNTIC